MLRFISRELPLQRASTGGRRANKTSSRKGQGAGLLWISGSCPPFCPGTTRPRTRPQVGKSWLLHLIFCELTQLLIIELAVLSSQADSVELISPLTKQTVVTKKQRTPNTNIVSNRIVLGRVSTNGSSAVQCKVSPTSRGPTATPTTTSSWSSASSTTMTQSPGVVMPEKKVQERKPSVTEPVVQSLTSAGSNGVGNSSRKRKVSFKIHY